MADDDMMSQDGNFDPMAQYARLSERVENQGRDIVDLRSNMNTGFRNLESLFNSLSSELRSGSKTQWPVIWSAIGVSFAVIAAVGALAYRPVLSNQDRLETALVRLSDATNSSLSDKLAKTSFQEFKDTYENNRVVARQDYNARFEKIEKDLDNQVPRKEHERVWASYDQRFADQQRQIDDLKQSVGGIYNARDIILDLRSRIDRVERNEAKAPP